MTLLPSCDPALVVWESGYQVRHVCGWCKPAVTLWCVALLPQLARCSDPLPSDPQHRQEGGSCTVMQQGYKKLRAQPGEWQPTWAVPASPFTYIGPAVPNRRLSWENKPCRGCLLQLLPGSGLCPSRTVSQGEGDPMPKAIPSDRGSEQILPGKENFFPFPVAPEGLSTIHPSRGWLHVGGSNSPAVSGRGLTLPSQKGAPGYSTSISESSNVFLSSNSLPLQPGSKAWQTRDLRASNKTLGNSERNHQPERHSPEATTKRMFRAKSDLSSIKMLSLPPVLDQDVQACS